MITKQFKKCRRKHLTLRAKCVSMIVLGLFLFGSSGYSQLKPKLPQKPQPRSITTKALANDYDYVPYGYEPVGTTDLCSRQLGTSIDIQGYFNGRWYRSTYGDGGYRVAMSVTKNAQEITDEDITGNYTVTSWRGADGFWTGESFVNEGYIGDDFYNATIEETDENMVILSNFASFGGSITGIIDKENRTITFPAQSYYMSNWDYWAIFCKQTDEFISSPCEENAKEEVIATYDEDFNITMNDWCVIIPLDGESYVCIDNSLSMSPNLTSDEGAYLTSCNNGESYNGVQFSSYVEQQGELARMCYSLTNTNDVSVTISLGVHADVMIGDNDRAPIARRKDQSENTYGLTMKDGYGAELCVLFGAGLAGVSRVDDFWFGYYGLNRNPYQMVGNYEPGSDWMQENGSYDSGMGWCWKNRTIPAGATVVFSYLLGVGEVNLEPNSSFEVTPDDPEGWNDLSRPHKLTLEGLYESPAGIDGMIEYAVEDSEEWTQLTQMLASGEGFSEELIATFDPEKETHTIRFRTVDAVGNTTMLTPIIYKDVYYHEITGIENKVYTYGDSIYQNLDNLICDLDSEDYVLNEYQNNVNVGTATFMAQGVFPNTIGRRTYSFEISPRELEGELFLPQNYFVFDGHPILPIYQFTCERPDSLLLDVDYSLAHKNNIYPGEGTVEVTCMGNYTGTLEATFTIDKAQVDKYLYDVVIPDEDILYDGEAHAADYGKETGVGEFIFTYVNEDNVISYDAPSTEGTYDVYLEIEEGPYYYGKENEKVGSFSIYNFDANEWIALNTLKAQLIQDGCTPSWNMEAGPVAVGKFEGLVIEKGHTVGLTLKEQNLSVVPTALAAFTELKSLDLSHNSLTGNVGLLAAALPNLTSLDVSYNKFTDLYPKISPDVTTLKIDHQNMDLVIPINFSKIDIVSLAEMFPTILLYDHKNQKYQTEIEFICTTSPTRQISEDDWGIYGFWDITTEYLYIVDVINYAYHGNSGDEVYFYQIGTNSSFKIALSFDPGDADFFGGVNAQDIQATILYAFGEYNELYPFNFTAADTYKDDNINVQDVICTVNIILSKKAQKSSSVLRAPEYASYESELNEASIYMEDGNIILDTDKPVAAISVHLTGNVAWSLDKYGLTQSVLESNLVGYSLDGATIPTGKTVIGSYQGEVNIEEVSLSDEKAHKITVSISNNQISGIENNLNDLIDDNTEIYDITGRRINSLGSGVNIIRKGNRTIKVVGGVIK